MASETLHAPRDRLTTDTLTHHHAIVSLIEELEAVDWYRQRAEDCEDPALRAILLHNMREEMEHACMVLEWLRRQVPDWAGQMDSYLYTKAPITEIEEEETGPDGGTESSDAVPARNVGREFTVGPMKREGD